MLGCNLRSIHCKKLGIFQNKILIINYYLMIIYQIILFFLSLIAFFQSLILSVIVQILRFFKPFLNISVIQIEVILGKIIHISLQLNHKEIIYC